MLSLDNKFAHPETGVWWKSRFCDPSEKHFSSTITIKLKVGTSNISQSDSGTEEAFGNRHAIEHPLCTLVVGALLFPFTIIYIKITTSLDPPAPASVQLSGEFCNGVSGNFAFVSSYF